MSDERRHDDDDLAPYLENVGAWVLGSLDEEETRAFAARLERSPELRAAVARVQPVADVLPMGADQLSAPPALRDRIMATVHEEAELRRAADGEPTRPRVQPPAPAGRDRRRLGRRILGLRPALAGGLAVLVLVVGVGVGVVVSGGGDGAPSGTTYSAKVSFPGASGQLVDRGSGGGQLKLTGLPAPPAGRVYQVWLLRKGAPVPTDALFSPNADGRSTVNVPGDLRDVEQVLVTDEPAGGSRAPTTKPFISVAL